MRVETRDDGERLDRLVAKAAGVSRRVARTMISAGRVQLNGKPVRILTRPVRAGSLLAIAVDAQRPAPEREGRRAGEPRLLFADRYLAVVDKPAGLLTEHDRFGSPALETIVPALLAARGERREIWLVHRLDAGTSGVIVLARTPMATKVLNEAFREGGVHKQYLALCRGRFAGDRLIEGAIAHGQGTRQVVSSAGKPAATRVASLASTEQASLVRAEPQTGRTHQIRVHLAHIGHPLWGDGLYGGPTYTESPPIEPIARPMLHAASLSFLHPKSGKPVVFSAPPPADFVALASRLGLSYDFAPQEHP